MSLTNPEIRVLASLIEKEAAVPESYPLSLNALRLACNQTTNRRPVVAYDDRTVESALLSLKSVGLVRYVHPSHGGRTTRYRHIADERWRLSRSELLVLSALALRGPQTAAEIKARISRLVPSDEDATIEEMLDTLAARSPEPFAIRVGHRPGERDDRWASVLGDPTAAGADVRDDTGEVPGDPALDADADVAFAGEPAPRSPAADRRPLTAETDVLAARIDALSATLADVSARLARLERELGLD